MAKLVLPVPWRTGKDQIPYPVFSNQFGKQASITQSNDPAQLLHLDESGRMRSAKGLIGTPLFADCPRGKSMVASCLHYLNSSKHFVELGASQWNTLLKEINQPIQI